MGRNRWRLFRVGHGPSRLRCRADNWWLSRRNHATLLHKEGFRETARESRKYTEGTLHE